MKLVILRILTWTILTGIVASSQVWAQQTNIDKRSSHSTRAKPLYVAQNSETTNQSANQTPNNSTTDQKSASTTAATTQTLPSDSVPGTIFPGVLPADQNGQSVAGDMIGVENGLWEGCEPGNCCTVCGGGYCAPPCWYTEQGARLLARSRPRKSIVTYEHTFVQQINPVTGDIENVDAFTQERTTHSASTNTAVGYDATIGRYLGRDSMDRDDFLEFKYWGMNTWFSSTMYDPGLGLSHVIKEGEDPVYLAGQLETPFYLDHRLIIDSTTAPIGVAGFDNTERHRFSLDSEIHNWELNLRLRPRGRPDQLVLHPNGRWRRECQPGTFLSYLVGLRYMTVGEGFHFHSEGRVLDLDNVLHSTSGDYDILTENDLLGFQLGADLIFRRCKWSWGLRTKVGPCINFARNEKQIVNDADGVTSFSTFNDRFTTRRQKTTLIAELGIEVNYKFKPNLTGRASYDCMWISGLALAPEQLTWELDPPGNATINTSGAVFAHGITLGLEWCW